MSFGRVFLVAVVLGMGIVLVPAALSHLPSLRGALVPEPKPEPKREAHASFVLGPGVSVRDQLTLAEVGKLKAAGFRTIIDLRPDGEAPDQPPASAVGEAARAAGLDFAYVPTPHGDIPDAVVEGLAKAMAGAEQPVLLYCRSGKRAARVWALAEASRPGGAVPDVIAAAVRGAGQPVDDLLTRITVRAATRKPAI